MLFTKKCRSAILLSLFGAACVTAATKDSVIGQWNFLNISKDTVWDKSGNGNHARIYNTKTNAKGREFAVDADSAIIKDNQTFYLTKSFTIEAFCLIKGYPDGLNNHNHAALFFRGDSRPGNDPVFLAVEPTKAPYDNFPANLLKNIRFRIDGGNGQTADVGVPATLDTALYIAAVLNDSAGTMALWINGEKKSEIKTSVRCFGSLDANSGPGVSLGSHPGCLPGFTQYKFPFIGIIEEIRLTNYAMSEKEIKLRNNNGPTQTILWKKASTAKVTRTLSPQRVICLNKSMPLNGEKVYTVSGKPAVLSNKKLTGVFITVPTK